ncbi:MAG: beta-lactamase family protein [Bacteroidia bacterium]|nr:beta-lactamase family protein [Bacteroidia bacterium]
MKYIVTLLVLSLSLQIDAQSLDKEKLNAFFDLVETNQKNMGSLSIFKGGKEVYQRSIGFSDVEQNMKANANTKYRIGSISKTFTAVIIMQLLEEEKLRLDTKLSEYYPDFGNADAITIEHLLRHRSGLFNFTNSPEYTTWMEEKQNKESLLEKMLAGGNNFSPGERIEYSNTGYVLLSYIIEDIEKKDFGEILTSRITDPLDLKSTYYGGKIDSNKDEALSYLDGSGSALATETDMSVPEGAGAIVSTPGDLNHFFTALFTGKLVSESSLELMTTMKDNYGFGLFEFPFYDKRATGHNGGIDGFASSSGYFRDDSLAITYVTNGSSWQLNNIMIAALSIYYGKEYEFPEFKTAFAVDPDQLEKYIGVYSSASFPLKITVTQKGINLMAQATGQSAFFLEPTAEHIFRFEQAGLVMEFNPDESSMVLKQGGGEFKLSKE